MVKLPTLKKKINAFLTKEDGKISKEKLLKTGILVSALGMVINNVHAGDIHSNSIGGEDGIKIDIDNDNSIGDNYVSGSHGHHVSHSSHSSHGSHGSGW